MGSGRCQRQQGKLADRRGRGSTRASPPAVRQGYGERIPHRWLRSNSPARRVAFRSLSLKYGGTVRLSPGKDNTDPWRCLDADRYTQRLCTIHSFVLVPPSTLAALCYRAAAAVDESMDAWVIAEAVFRRRNGTVASSRAKIDGRFIDARLSICGCSI
jgi:hypothetical protein